MTKQVFPCCICSLAVVWRAQWVVKRALLINKMLFWSPPGRPSVPKRLAKSAAVRSAGALPGERHRLIFTSNAGCSTSRAVLVLQQSIQEDALFVWMFAPFCGHFWTSVESFVVVFLPPPPSLFYCAISCQLKWHHSLWCVRPGHQRPVSFIQRHSKSFTTLW